MEIKIPTMIKGKKTKHIIYKILHFNIWTFCKKN